MIFPTILIGNATIVVIFLSALVWRYRDHSIKAGVALGAAIGVKFFAAPLVVWLIWTRRYKAALVACATAPILIMSAWALIGFEGLTHYRQQLANVAATLGITGPYLQALVQQAGASEATAFKVGIAVGVLLLLAAGFYARRLSDEIGAFALCWLSVLAISPIAWPGYAGGIVIALAAKFPAYGRRWLLLLAFWTGWWHSPFAYKSIGLSIATSAVAVSLTVATLLKDAKQPETIARPEAATAKPAVAI
jgi:alpha-1,2-mannosyltransferase